MDLIGQLAAIGAVLSLLAVTLWWLRRRGFASVRPRRGERRLLETVDRLPLGPQHSLHLIRLGEQALVVACSPAGCSVVATRPWTDVASEGGA